MAWGDNLLDWLGVPMGTSSPDLSQQQMQAPSSGTSDWGQGAVATPDSANYPTPPVPSAGMRASPDQPAVPGDSSSGMPASHNLAAALQKLGEGLKGPQQTQPPAAQAVHSSPQMPQSAFSRGGGGGLDNLVSSLQRRMYLPIGYQAAGSNNIRGLLGY